MKNNLYQHITASKAHEKKLLAVLLDPDKLSVIAIPNKIAQLHSQNVDFILVGGSTVENGITELCVKAIKDNTSLPVILFPGDFKQITNNADALLFLSLLSGRNPEFLIEQQLNAVPVLSNSDLEIIPTGYILIDGGTITATQKVSKTQPIPQNDIEKIVNTAIASQYLGKRLVYLEAGSGATEAVEPIIIKRVSQSVEIPIIVGGGIRTKKQLNDAYRAGADLIVIGTAFEENNNILSELK